MKRQGALWFQIVAVSACRGRRVDCVSAFLLRLRNHPGLVHDEYGHFQGVVTNADILEAIVGDFRTDEGPIEPDAVQRDDGSWLIAGSTPVDEMADRLFIALPPERSYHTAAGLVLNQLGHLPAIGESFDHQGWRFEVVDLDGRRIDRILARRIAAGRRRAAV